MIIKTLDTKKAFTLVELLVYISGLLVIGTVLTLMIVQFYGLYREIITVPRADRIGLQIVDRLTKDIRSASSVDLIGSQFETTNGVLTVTQQNNTNTITKRFFVEDGIIKYQEGTQTPIALSSNDFYVSNFNFNYVSTGISQAIRFTMELQFRVKDGIETKNYTGFAILRESYE